jgi:hypothetical protein
VDPSGDYNSPDNWRPSTNIGGSPGNDDPIPGTPAGDFNGNGLVEQGDLDLVLLHWGALADPPPQGWTQELPRGSIDQDELDAVLLNWGRTHETSQPAAAAADSIPLCESCIADYWASGSGTTPVSTAARKRSGEASHVAL